MELMEIILLVGGAAIFFASFFIPERKEGQSDTEEVTKELIAEMIDEELEDAKTRISHMTDETIDYSMEKAERSLEKVLNEKMLAFGEYSDSVMTQIGNNHQETVFMYEMLNNSKQDLTNLLLQTDKNAQDAFQSAQDALTACEGAKEIAEEANKLAKLARVRAKKAQEQAVVAEENMLMARKNAQGETGTRDIEPEVPEQKIEKPVPESDFDEDSHADAYMPEEPAEEEPEVYEEEFSFRRHVPSPFQSDSEIYAEDDPDDVYEEELQDRDDDVNLKFSPDEESSVNSNERILELHKRGKSNIAIARALGLGVGEVKLVIDLFETK